VEKNLLNRFIKWLIFYFNHIITYSTFLQVIFYFISFIHLA